MVSFLAITVPCATVIMCVDHFVHVLVAFARAVAPVRSALGFPKTIAEAAVVSDAVVDVASIAEGRVRPAPTAVPAPGS